MTYFCGRNGVKWYLERKKFLIDPRIMIFATWYELNLYSDVVICFN